MIDYWIIFELMSNHEMLHPKSVYFHKDGNGKLIAGPIWDFDFETLVEHRRTGWINFGSEDSPLNWMPWAKRNWWNVLLRHDATLRADVRNRWEQWYPFLRSVPEFIRSNARRSPQPSHATTDDGPSYRRETKTATSHLLSIRPLNASNPYIGSGSNGSTGKFRPGKQATLRKKRNFIQKNHP